jgi:hypothetical protein
VGAYVDWTARVEDPKPCEIPTAVEETALKKALKFVIVKVEMLRLCLVKSNRTLVSYL